MSDAHCPGQGEEGSASGGICVGLGVGLCKGGGKGVEGHARTPSAEIPAPVAPESVEQGQTRASSLPRATATTLSPAPWLFAACRWAWCIRRTSSFPPPPSSPYHPRAARPRGLPGHLRCLRLRRDPLLHLHPPPGDGGQMSGLCGNARRLRRPGRRQGPRGVIQCTCATLTGPHEPRAGRPTGRTPRRQPAHISRTTPASNPSSRAPSSSARRVEAPSPPQLECYGPRPPPLLAALRPRTTGIGGPAGSVPGPAEALPCGGGQPRCGGS